MVIHCYVVESEKYGLDLSCILQLIAVQILVDSAATKQFAVEIELLPK